MDEYEYARKMAEIESVDKSNDNEPVSEKQEDEIDELINIVNKTKKPHEIEDKIEEEKKEAKRIEDENEKLQNMMSLREFMKTEEFLRLGTKARIPVPIDLNGYQFKVYVRALSRNEIQACRVKAQHTGEDMDFLAVLKACTDEDGVPYEEEVLEQLGYARIRDISEAIGIASGENPANTESAIRKQVIDNFLQKIENET